MFRTPLTLCACLALFVCAAVAAQKGSSSHCDPLVDVQGQGPHTYKDRGDRCEGEYQQKVSGGTGIRLAALTDTVPEFKFAPGDKAHLAWTTEGNTSVRLRATSLRSRHYYRMDSTRPAGSSTWVWPADILGQYALTSREIAIVAVTTRKFADGERDVYVPVRMAKNADPPTDKLYTLVASPVETLRQLFITITPLGPDGTREAAIIEDQDVRQAPYPAYRGIRVPIPALPRHGYYVVELAGLTDGSKPVSAELTLYHGR
jgi:hypothetical protein